MSGQLWDAPNQQVVRADQSPPWEEGSGGATATPNDDLDSMTKAELLAYAAAHNIEADDQMTKADIRAAIDAGAS